VITLYQNPNVKTKKTTFHLSQLAFFSLPA